MQSQSIIEKAQRILKTDLRYLIKGGFWLTINQFFLSLVSFITAIAFSHLVSKEVYGEYRFILSVIAIIATFNLTGLGTAVTQSVARKFEGTFLSGKRLSLRWGVFTILISIIVAVYYVVQGNMVIAISIAIAGIFTTGTKAYELYDSYLKGKQDFFHSALYSVITSIVTGIILIISMIVFPNNTILLIVILFGSNFLFDVIFFTITKKQIANTDVEYTSLAYSKHLSAINILSNIAAQLDKIIIFHFLGAAQLAIYSFAVAFPKQVRTAFAIVTTLATPKVSERPAEELKKSIPRKFIMFILIFLPCIILYILLAPWLYKIFFPNYLESIWYSQMYIWVLLVGGNISDLALSTKHAVKEKYILNLSSSILYIGLMVILIKPFGIMGIIVATIISKYSTSILSLILLRNLKDVHKKSEAIDPA